MRKFGATRQFGLVATLVAGTALAMPLIVADRTGVAAASPAASVTSSPASPSPAAPAPAGHPPAPAAPDSPTHIPAATPPPPPTTTPAAPAAPASPAAARVAAPISVVLTTIPGGAETADPGPTLSVGPDGRGTGLTTDANAAPERANGHIPPDVLAATFAEARALSTADMGEPKEGKDSTLLDFLGTTPDQDVHLVAYGLDTAGELTKVQQANRARFAYLCTKLTAAFIPDRA